MSGYAPTADVPSAVLPCRPHASTNTKHNRAAGTKPVAKWVDLVILP